MVKIAGRKFGRLNDGAWNGTSDSENLIGGTRTLHAESAEKGRIKKVEGELGDDRCRCRWLLGGKGRIA